MIQGGNRDGVYDIVHIQYVKQLPFMVFDGIYRNTQCICDFHHPVSLFRQAKYLLLSAGTSTAILFGGKKYPFDSYFPFLT
jgi:hypothetical protein